MAETHCGRSNGLVILVFNRPQDEVIALTRFSNLFEDGLVLFHIGRPPYHQRHIHRGPHFFHGFDGVFSRSVLAVGVDALQLQHDDLGAEFLDTLLCPRPWV